MDQPVAMGPRAVSSNSKWCLSASLNHSHHLCTDLGTRHPHTAAQPRSPCLHIPAPYPLPSSKLLNWALQQGAEFTGTLNSFLLIDPFILSLWEPSDSNTTVGLLPGFMLKKKKTTPTLTLGLLLLCVPPHLSQRSNCKQKPQEKGGDGGKPGKVNSERGVRSRGAQPIPLFKDLDRKWIAKQYFIDWGKAHMWTFSEW